MAADGPMEMATSETALDGGAMAPALGMSDAAVARVAELLKAESKPGLMLRVRVDGGGCSGFLYGFSFDDETRDDDHVFPCGAVTLVTDESSLDLIAGSVIDYVDELGGTAFRIVNPNATASCGCGNSFAV